MTVGTNNFAFLDFFFNAIESNGAPEASHSEQFILAFFVMKIKYSLSPIKTVSEIRVDSPYIG